MCDGGGGDSVLEFVWVCVYVGVWVNTCKALRTVRGKNNNSSNLLCVSYSSKCFISFKSLDAKIICGVIILSFQMRKQRVYAWTVSGMIFETVCNEYLWGVGLKDVVGF